MTIHETCLLLADVPGLVLPAKPWILASEPDASSALRHRDSRFLSRPGTLLVQPEPESEAATGEFTVTVYPTSACNLHCSYCYASSGRTRQELSFERYRIILQDILCSTRFPRLRLHLHGGGEPTLNPVLLRQLVHEFVARSQSLETPSTITMATNGAFGKIAWQTIKEYRIRCAVSWDGPDDIQHGQRPFATGKNSHPIVWRNIEKLIKAQLLSSVRLTTTPLNIDRLPEIVHFLHNAGVQTLMTAPLSVAGRQKEQDDPGIAPDHYAHAFQEAYILCCQLGIRLIGPGTLPFERPTDQSCGASGWNFVITPWAEISACLRVQQAGDEGAESFLLGPWESGANAFTFAKAQRAKLQQRHVDALTDCTDCYLRYRCAGGCPMGMQKSLNPALNQIDDLLCDLTTSCTSSVLSAVRQGYLPPGWIAVEKGTEPSAQL